MSNRSAWAFMIGSTLLALVLAAGLAATTLRQAPDLRGQSTTEARAASIAPEVAEQIGSQIGEPWQVSAKLARLERYRGRFGLPAWQADYDVVVTAADAPGFRQTERVVRSIGPGARLVDSGQLPDTALYSSLGALTPEQRASLLTGVAEHLGTQPLLLVERLSATGASRPWLDHGRPDPRLVALGEQRGMRAESLYVVESTGDPAVTLWGWDGTRFLAIASLHPTTGQATPF